MIIIMLIMIIIIKVIIIIIIITIITTIITTTTTTTITSNNDNGCDKQNATTTTKSCNQNNNVNSNIDASCFSNKTFTYPQTPFSYQNFSYHIVFLYIFFALKFFFGLTLGNIGSRRRTGEGREERKEALECSGRQRIIR